MTKTIYFVRHGECVANADNVFAGCRNDSPLTQKGLEQASVTAKTLRGERIDLIITSPLQRARKTAERIADELGYSGEIVVEHLLTERDFGSVTGKPKDMGFAALDEGIVDGVEALERLAERMQHALSSLKSSPQKYILVVGHGGAERMLRTVYEGRPYDTFLETEPLSNGQYREYKL